MPELEEMDRRVREQNERIREQARYLQWLATAAFLLGALLVALYASTGDYLLAAVNAVLVVVAGFVAVQTWRKRRSAPLEY